MATTNVQEQFEGDLGQAIGRARDFSTFAMSQLTVGAMFDERLLGGVLAGALLASNYSQLNAAVRIPSTLDHPSIPVSNPQNTGKV